MDFLNREEELSRLDALVRRKEGSLAVVYGRRRLGKTRLLLEWSANHGGLYAVADASSPELQRRYLADAVSARLPGFAEVEYRDWRGLLSRLARDAAAAHFRGPIVLDEFPYLVAASPELPSVLQQWVDHEARASRLVVALAGSSQRMMQGLVLDADAPLHGRAREVLEVGPLGPEWIAAAFNPGGASQGIELFSAWGGVPRYWELALDEPGGVRDGIERLVLDPLGPLHDEPNRLLLEETPPATEVRPLLDAIGAGAHRASEIGSRVGRPATSLARPLARLQSMGLVRREVPFGEPERGTRRSLYRIADPFLRLWFRVVAPNRARLATSDRTGRLALLDRHWPQLVAETWEELCRTRLPRISPRSALGRLGPWGPASRWWRGEDPEWEIVASSLDGQRLLLGEVRSGGRPASASRALVTRSTPPVAGTHREVIRALFVPEAGRAARDTDGVLLVTGEDLIDRATRR